MLKIITARSEKVLFENKWISVRETSDGYTYSHAIHCKGHAVAVLGMRKHPKHGMQFLGRFEDNPAHKVVEHELYSLTGSIDEYEGSWEKSALKYAVKELEEESGIKADADRFISLGKVRPSKSADTIVHLFEIWLTIDEEPLETPPGDGTGKEDGCYCDWVTRKDIVNSQDPILHSMLTRINI